MPGGRNLLARRRSPEVRGLTALFLTGFGCTRFAGPLAVRHSGPAAAPGYTIR